MIAAIKVEKMKTIVTHHQVIFLLNKRDVHTLFDGLDRPK